ncbi:MAG: thermonuclease family protein [archaeon]
MIEQQYNSNAREKVIISRVIDGDTLELDDGRIIRLLNINSPEKGVIGAEKSAEFLSSFQSNQVEIEITGKDKYFRNLAKLYTPNYINLELVQKGLASKFLVQKDELKQFADAEKNAIQNSSGIWEKSYSFNCFNSSIDYKNEIITLENHCPSISTENWTLKDESRTTYYFKRNISSNLFRIHSGFGIDNSTDIFWNSKQPIWNNDRDSLYLFDENKKLVHYETYGYY